MTPNVTKMRKRSKSRRPPINRSALTVISVQKSDKQRKKNKNKSKKKIKKLFDQLRNESHSEESSTSTNCTVIEANNVTITENMNKQNNNSVIIIEDDDLNINGLCSNQCSTPLPTSKHLIKQTNVTPENNANIGQSSQDDVVNLTKEINKDSYVTIDLTTNSFQNTNNESSLDTVIDLVNGSDVHDLNENDNFSMSGDSEVTVINTRRKRKVNNTRMQKFSKGIANLNSTEKGKLLEYIAKKIFNGCQGPNSSSNSIKSIKNAVSRATETAEDAYIKEVILGQSCSRNSVGSNIYNPERDIKNKTGLRMVIIDGSNVAMQHTKGRIFSVKGLKICIDYFVQRGHIVKAFVPQFRCKLGKSTDGKLLDHLERLGLVVYTPSREIQGKMITSYDDRYIVQCAAEFDGVIVSSDNYRDLLRENPRWRHVIENRLLQFTWVGDMIMFPRDPLGRNGPTLEQFLKHPPQQNNNRAFDAKFATLSPEFF